MNFCRSSGGIRLREKMATVTLLEELLSVS